MNDEPHTVKLTVSLVPEAHERLWTAAALNGETMTEVVNRALQFYDQIHRMEPGQSLRWHLVDGSLREILMVNPAKSLHIWLRARRKKSAR